MKSLLVVVLVLSVTYATVIRSLEGRREQRINTNLQQNNKLGEPGKKMPGVCLTKDEVTYLCVGNTTLGIKLGAAVQTCTGREH